MSHESQANGSTTYRYQMVVLGRSVEVYTPKLYSFCGRLIQCRFENMRKISIEQLVVGVVSSPNESDWSVATRVRDGRSSAVDL